MARSGTAGIPKTPDELADALMDPAMIGKLFGGDPSAFGEFTAAYVRRLMASDSTIQAQLRENLQAGMGQFLRDNGAQGRGR